MQTQLVQVRWWWRQQRQCGGGRSRGRSWKEVVARLLQLASRGAELPLVAQRACHVKQRIGSAIAHRHVERAVHEVQHLVCAEVLANLFGCHLRLAVGWLEFWHSREVLSLRGERIGREEKKLALCASWDAPPLGWVLERSLGKLRRV